MTDERCQRYLEDPEGHQEHLAECESCRVLTSVLDTNPADLVASVDPNTLPLASWEGASHRPWALVLSLVSGIFALALLLCFAAGSSIASEVSSSTNLLDMIRGLVRMTGDAAPHAPAKWQIVIGILFFAVNGLLVLLLRRAPRGMDA